MGYVGQGSNPWILLTQIIISVIATYLLFFVKEATDHMRKIKTKEVVKKYLVEVFFRIGVNCITGTLPA